MKNIAESETYRAKALGQLRKFLCIHCRDGTPLLASSKHENERPCNARLIERMSDEEIVRLSQAINDIVQRPKVSAVGAIHEIKGLTGSELIGAKDLLTKADLKLPD